MIGFLRMIPIVTVLALAIWRKHVMIVIWAASFIAATIANTFYQNQTWAGAMSSISAYAAAYMVIPYLVNNYKGKK